MSILDNCVDLLDHQREFLPGTYTLDTSGAQWNALGMLGVARVAVDPDHDILCTGPVHGDQRGDALRVVFTDGWYLDFWVIRDSLRTITGVTYTLHRSTGYVVESGTTPLESAEDVLHWCGVIGDLIVSHDTGEVHVGFIPDEVPSADWP